MDTKELEQEICKRSEKLAADQKQIEELQCTLAEKQKLNKILEGDVVFELSDSKPGYAYQHSPEVCNSLTYVKFAAVVYDFVSNKNMNNYYDHVSDASYDLYSHIDVDCGRKIVVNLCNSGLWAYEDQLPDPNAFVNESNFVEVEKLDWKMTAYWEAPMFCWFIPEVVKPEHRWRLGLGT